MATKERIVAQRQFATERYILSTYPVLYLPLWKRDSGGSNKFISDDAYGHVCTVSEAVWRLDGRYFDGLDDRIGIPDQFRSNTGTILIWFKTTSDELEQVKLFTISRNADATVTSFQIMLEQRDAKTVGLIAGEWVGGTAQWISSTAIATYNPKTNFNWQFVAITHNGTTPVVYLNLADVTTFTAEIDKTKWLDDLYSAASPSDTCTLGAGATNGAYSLFMGGVVGEVWDYDRVLTLQEIQNIYQKTKWRYG